MSSHWIASKRYARWIALILVLSGTTSKSAFGQQMPVSNEQMQGQMQGQMTGVWPGGGGRGGGGRESGERFVLLNTGRVMKGHVTPNANGYLIDQNHGKIQLSHNDVRFIVDTLHEAYCRQRDGVVEPTPATHLSLANWCISYQLYDDASEEVRKCLKVDPDNGQAKRLLSKLTETIRATLEADAERETPRKTPEGFLAPDVEPLGGLSQETASKFTSRVQPLMLHKCGNASCHGLASTNDFKILSPRVGGRSSRHTAERNLEEIFQRVDLDDVDHSKLLEILKGPHGGKGPIFFGPNSSVQRKTYESWVKAVAKDKNKEKDSAERQSVKMSQRASKQSKKQTPPATPATPATSTGAFRPAKPFGPSVQQASYNEEQEAEPEESANRAEPKELKSDSNNAAAMARVPTDDFDPEQFNRQFGNP